MLLEAGCLLGIGVAARAAAHFLFAKITKRIAHLETGEHRRDFCPVDDFVKSSGGSRVDTSGLKHKRQVRTLKCGKQAFAQIIAPADRKPSYVLVFLHGYTSHGDMYLEDAATLARKGAAVLLPDLPCHGRSDGLLAFVPDWWEWIAEIWEIIEAFMPLAREEGNPKIFLGGISLGGGVAACLCVQRPTYFSGVVLVAPMLFVSDDVKPNIVVQKVFKWFLAPLLPRWPITPVKDLDMFDFRVPEQGYKFCAANPMSMRGLKARLASAFSFGFVFPDWIDLQLDKFRTPVLIMHGDADKITDPALSKRLHEEASSVDKTLKLYEGAYHCELLSCLPGFEHLVGEWQPAQTECTQTCLSDMASWLSARA